MTEAVPGNDRLDTIRKLLAKAESTTFEAERDAYNTRAAKLIAKYGIDAALLNATQGSAEQEVVGDRIAHVPAPYAYEKSALLHNVAEPLRVHTVRRNARLRRNGYDVHLFGFTSDLERAELLFTSLLVQASFGLATVRPSQWGESAVTYRKSWIWGFTNSVHARLVAAEGLAVAEADSRGAGPSTDLVLVLADRKAIVDRAVSETYPTLQPGRSVKTTGSGYGAGQAAGSRANLNGTGIAGTARGSIGR